MGDIDHILHIQRGGSGRSTEIGIAGHDQCHGQGAACCRKGIHHRPGGVAGTILPCFPGGRQGNGEGGPVHGHVGGAAVPQHVAIEIEPNRRDRGVADGGAGVVPQHGSPVAKVGIHIALTIGRPGIGKGKGYGGHFIHRLFSGYRKSIPQGWDGSRKISCFSCYIVANSVKMASHIFPSALGK